MQTTCWDIVYGVKECWQTIYSDVLILQPPPLLLSLPFMLFMFMLNNFNLFIKIYHFFFCLPPFFIQLWIISRQDIWVIFAPYCNPYCNDILCFTTRDQNNWNLCLSYSIRQGDAPHLMYLQYIKDNAERCWRVQQTISCAFSCPQICTASYYNSQCEDWLKVS